MDQQPGEKLQAAQEQVRMEFGRVGEGIWESCAVMMLPRLWVELFVRPAFEVGFKSVDG
ncbi:MAG TPA: hypothetical protein VGD99_12715 [Anaerolineae bacterium]|jgi:hypothetical protein